MLSVYTGTFPLAAPKKPKGVFLKKNALYEVGVTEAFKGAKVALIFLLQRY
jgi:hypothetical protein